MEELVDFLPVHIVMSHFGDWFTGCWRFMDVLRGLVAWNS